MESLFHDFISCLSESIQIRNTYLNDVIHTFKYHLFIIENHFSNSDSKDDKILNKTSNIIFISEYIKNKNKCQLDSDFFIICLEKALIFVQQNEIKRFSHFFTNNRKSTIYFQTEDIRSKIEQSLNLRFQNSSLEKYFSKEELKSFTSEFSLKNKELIGNMKIINFLSIIIENISSYLLIKAYDKSINYDRVDHYQDYFSKKNDEEIIKANEYIIIRDIEKSINVVCLIYNIKLEQLFAMKIFSEENMEKLYERERLNYQRIRHPFFPKYFGIVQNQSYKAIAIEYIQGKSIDKIEEMNLSEKNKFRIIFQLIIGVEYLHKNNFIYRDLKPNNIFITNEKKYICIVDFDRMIESDINYQYTKYFQDNGFIAPEILKGNAFSNKVDIYSIGKIIETVFSNELTENSEYKSINEIVTKCTNENDKLRPNIYELVGDFFEKMVVMNANDIKEMIFYIALEADQNNIGAQYELGLIYYEGKFIPRDINKSIYYLTLAADQNHMIAQYKLGLIYYEGKFIPRDINKSIYYFALAASQNDVESICNLGLIYDEGKFVARDINKSIYYYTLAADQNNMKAQFNLGLNYYEGEFIPRDINKSIYYFALAANQNNMKAQFNLGVIYYKGQYISQDIYKSIYYFTLAANQGYIGAQFILGLIYNEGKFISRDINKSIYYFTLAANQNDIDAQYKLGLIYYEGNFISRDINESIYYYTLAADQNHIGAQFNLGLIYYEGKYIPRDINKSIYYFTVAANQNDIDAKFNLGLIYYEGKFISRDINKSIYYLTLASDQNHMNAQYNLGLIYYEGESISRDINKSIYYLTLSANQNYMKAQYNLGLIYLNKMYGHQDINKAIHYLNLASNQNLNAAQYELGLIYEEGKYVSKNINKSSQYYFRAANNNHPYGLLKIGLFYLYGNCFPKNISKSISYLTLSVNNHCNKANYFLGCIYFEGIGVDRNIDKSIKYYKEGSSFNNNYCKNNLGIIYKNIKKNEISIEYFEEAIRQKNDCVSMYNLGHMYFYGDFINRDIDKSIELLIKSANLEFFPSQILLSLAITKKLSISINSENISKELEKHGNKSKELSHIVLDIINDFYMKEYYQLLISEYERIEYIYDHKLKHVNYYEYIENDVGKNVEKHNEKLQRIKLAQNYCDQDFYNGFGLF